MKRIARLNLQQSSENTEENLPECCIYSKCNLKSIEGYNFCYQHIYADKLTKKNIKKCTYKTNEEVCNELITLPNDDNSFCTFHSTLEKKRERKKSTSTSTASCLIDESKYRLIDDLNVDSKNALNEQVIRKLTEKQLSENNDAAAAGTSRNHNEDLIDFELFDSEDSDNLDDELDYEDALEHAAVYTPEEVLKIFQVKLNKLQRLYKKQLNLLNDRMKYDRKVYLLLNENEKLKYGPEHELDFKNQAEQELLKAAKIYKKYSGLKDYLRENFTQKKKKKDDLPVTSVPPAISAFLASKVKPQCVFLENEKRCEKKPVPLSKYCLNHILNDQTQVLFCACGESECKVPVVASITPNCPLHLSSSVVEKLKTSEETATYYASTSQDTQEHQTKTTTHAVASENSDSETESDDSAESDDETKTKETKPKQRSDISEEDEDSNTSTSSSTTTSSSNTSTTSNSSTDSSSSSGDSTSSSSSSPEKSQSTETEIKPIESQIEETNSSKTENQMETQ